VSDHIITEQTTKNPTTKATTTMSTTTKNRVTHACFLAITEERAEKMRCGILNSVSIVVGEAGVCGP
jgi:hypothetical protein